MLTVSFQVLCDLIDFEAAGGLFVYLLLLFVQLFASRVSSHCKRNMGAGSY